MGTKTFDGVRFAAWSDDHLPAHVHGFYAGVEVILDLDFETRKIRLADRWDRIMPLNAKISDVHKSGGQRIGTGMSCSSCGRGREDEKLDRGHYGCGH